MRTVVIVNETGSLTKAAERLGLSQPAVTAQIKRLQGMIGGELFTRTANGTTPTELGRLVLQQARRMLDANDQLFHLGGTSSSESPIRLGLSSLFAVKFPERDKAQPRPEMLIYADQSSVIRKGLADGYIDVGCFFTAKPVQGETDYAVVAEIEWPLLWIRARDFVLSPVRRFLSSLSRRMTG